PGVAVQAEELEVRARGSGGRPHPAGDALGGDVAPRPGAGVDLVHGGSFPTGRACGARPTRAVWPVAAVPVGVHRHRAPVTFGTTAPPVGIGPAPAGFPPRRRCQMSTFTKMTVAVAVLLLVLGLALTGCRKDDGSGGGG